MTDVCEFHKEAMAKLDTTASAMEGKVAKSSMKWVATIFAMPTVGAILFAWAFMSSADYRYGTNLQAQTNAAKIQLLEERTLTTKADLAKAQAQIMEDVTEIKKDVKLLILKSGGK